MCVGVRVRVRERERERACACRGSSTIPHSGRDTFIFFRISPPLLPFLRTSEFSFVIITYNCPNVPHSGGKMSLDVAMIASVTSQFQDLYSKKPARGRLVAPNTKA